jgi:DNA-binding NarL/FixJ family response regulator
MPGMDGLALIESVIGEGCVRRGVIVLTNRWDHAEIRDRLADWGVTVLPKPFSPSRLSEVVESLAAGRPTTARMAPPPVSERGAC